MWLVELGNAKGGLLYRTWKTSSNTGRAWEAEATGEGAWEAGGSCCLFSGGCDEMGMLESIHASAVCFVKVPENPDKQAGNNQSQS